MIKTLLDVPCRWRLCDLNVNLIFHAYCVMQYVCMQISSNDKLTSPHLIRDLHYKHGF